MVIVGAFDVHNQPTVAINGTVCYESPSQGRQKGMKGGEANDNGPFPANAILLPVGAKVRVI